MRYTSEKSQSQKFMYCIILFILKNDNQNDKILEIENRGIVVVRDYGNR